MVSTRVGFAVALSVAVLLAGVGPVVGMGDALDRVEDRHLTDGDENYPDDAAARTGGEAAQYKVSLDNVTVRTWLLRDSTVRNATVREVVVQNVTTPDGARENVTLTNVTVGEFVIDRGRLLNVTATRLVVRNKSVLNVPGGDFFDPNVENRTINRQWTRNATVAGVVIDRLTIDAAFLCGNASLGEQAENASQFDPRNDENAPAITVNNGTAEEALIINGEASNWSVGSVDESAAQNASLPQGCQRGQGNDGGGQGNDGDGQDGDGGTTQAGG